jgi:hypothetical protein
MDAQQIPNPVAAIFDGEDSGWFFPSAGVCKRESLAPNMLAFCEATATLALVVKRSFAGVDFALSEAGLCYIEAMLHKGALKDGRPVRAAFVVLADVDLRSPDLRSSRQLKLVSYLSAKERRECLNGQPAYPGKFGPFWWITADTLIDGDEAF